MNEEIMWVTGTPRFTNSDADVVIRIESIGTNRKGTGIYFYNDSFRKITNKDYIMVGLSPSTNRVYFKESSPEAKGFKLSVLGKNNSHRRVRLSSVQDKFVGTYKKLMFDADKKLWYVEHREN